MTEPDISWLEISLIVTDGELAEAVSDVLARYIPEGVFIESTGIAYEPDSHGRVIGPYRVCGYLPHDEKLEATRQKIDEGLWYLGRITPLPDPVYKPVIETNWVDNWKQHYRPIRIGKNLTILPIWEENPAPGSIPILIDPGMAFGTGTHPTTQLSLELIEEILTDNKPQTMIDVGCGSAILSIAAARLGVLRILGVDIDEDAVVNANLNIQNNQVSKKISIEVGSVEDILAGKYDINQSELVVANILTHILIRLFDEGLDKLVSPGGTLVLSGILDEREVDLKAVILKAGLEVSARRQMGDWIALVCKKP